MDFPFLGQGSLEAARAALMQRPGGLNGAIDAQSGGMPGAAPGVVAPQPAAPVAGPSGNMIAGQALMAGANQLGQRPTVSPQQQAQLVQLLKARMAQQQGQQPPPQPAPGGGLPPMMQNAPPMPGMPQ